MSQFGMQLPGGQVRRGAGMNVYTGLLFCAVVALAAACAMMYMQGSKLGPDGNAFGVQDPKDIKLAK
jgi:hypothetical protein